MKPLFRILAALALAVGTATAANADTLGTPVVNRPGTSLSVNGVDGGYPIAVTGTISASNPSVGSNAAAIPTSSTLVGGKDGSGNLQAVKVNSSSALTVDGSGVTQPISAASLPLPAGAAQDRISASASPFACRITDGASFYDAAKTGQLPTALDGSGFLKTHEQGTATVSGTVTATQATGSNLHVVVDTAPTTAVTGTFFQSTQPVSSAVQDPAFIAPAATAAPSKAVVVMGKSADGTPVYNPIPLAAGSASVVISGTVTANAGTGTLAVSAASLPLPSGASTSAKQPALGTAGSASADVITVQGVASMTALKTDGSGTTQPVSGTVTANAGTNLNTSALALDATLTGGTQQSKITDGTNISTVKAASTLPAATDKALVVTLRDSPSVTGTITANAGTNLNTSALALDATLTGGTAQSKVTDGTNIAKVQAASTPAAAADKALVVSLSPNSPLGAGSAVIGHVIADTGSTTAVTGNVTVVQPTGTNLHAVLDTTSTTAVTQATAANLNATVVQATGTNLHAVLDTTSTTACTQATGTNLHVVTDATSVLAANQSVNAAQVAGSATSTAATGVQKVGIVGNAAATVDAALAAGTAPTNGVAAIAQYDTTQPAPTNTQTVGVQADQAGNLLGFPGVQTKTGAVWTSATSQNTLQFPTGTATVGAPLGSAAVLIQLVQTTTITVGAVTFQGTYDGTNWVTIPVAQVLNPQTMVSLTNPYTFVPSTNQPFLLLPQGFQQIRTNLTTAITGSGSVSPFWTVLAVVDGAPSAQGSPNTAANAWPHKITDGTNTAAVKAASTAAAATDPALVVAVSPNNSVAVTQATGTNLHAVLDTTSTTAVTQATGTNLHAVLDTTSTTACTQATGTNLHVVTDATSVLAANQSVNAAQIGGTNTVNGGVAGTLGVGGTQANNATINANPMLTGAKASTWGSAPSAATAANIVQGLADLDGSFYVREGSPNGVSSITAALSTTLTQIVAAPAAAHSVYITDITVQSTTAVASTLQVKWGTGTNCATGTVVGPIWVSPANTANATTMTATHWILKVPAATALCVVCGSATNTCLTIVNGYVAP